MRTPWRFVADLVLRKPTAHAADKDRTTEIEAVKQPSLVDDQTRESDVKVADASTILPERPDNIGTSPLAAPEPVAGTPETGTEVKDIPLVAVESTISIEERPAVDPKPETESDQIEIVSQPAPATATGGVAEAKPRRKSKRGPKLASPDDRTIGDGDLSDAAPRTLAEEMVDLEDAVTSLRRQLAKKLIEQNEQLRKLLSRYDHH